MAAAVTHLGQWQSKHHIRAADHQAVQELLRLLEQQLLSQQTLQRLECRQLSNILWACCKLKYVHTPIIRTCLAELLAKLSSADRLQHVSIVLYGLAESKAEVPTDQLQQLIATAGRPELLHTADPQHIANAIWAAAKMGVEIPEHQLHSMLTAATRPNMLRDSTPQGISNIIWGVAKMGLQIPECQLINMLLAAARSDLLRISTPQNIANVIWGVATMGLEIPEHQLCSMLSAAARPNLLRTSTPQNIANIIWAIATMGVVMPEHQLDSMLAAAGRPDLLRISTPQGIANIIWGVAKMGQRKIPKHQLHDMLDSLLANDTDLVPQSISNTLWGLATMKAIVPLLQLQQLEVALVASVARAQPNALSNTLWAYAELLFFPERLFSALQQQQLWSMLLPLMDSQELANTALALGTLGHRDEQLMGFILQQAVKLLQQNPQRNSSSVTGQFNTQHVCNLCWAIAVLDLQQFAAEVVYIMGTCSDQWDNLNMVGLRQVQQVHLWLQDMQQPQAKGLQMVLSEQQLQQCRAARAVQLQQCREQQSSAFHSEVFGLLQLLPVTWQISPAMETLSEPDGMFSIDISVATADGVRLAIEVDGPTHFRLPDRGLTGNTLYRNRALAARGYVVISVASHEWNQLQGQHQQLQYLQQLLQESLPKMNPMQQLPADCKQRGGGTSAKLAGWQTAHIPTARLPQLNEEPAQPMQSSQRQQQPQHPASTSGSRVRRVRRKVV